MPPLFRNADLVMTISYPVWPCRIAVLLKYLGRIIDYLNKKVKERNARKEKAEKKKAFVDHVTERKGGENRRENLSMCCHVRFSA